MYFICLFSVPWFIYSSGQNRVNEKLFIYLSCECVLVSVSFFFSLFYVDGHHWIKWWTFNLCIGSLTHVLMDGMKRTTNIHRNHSEFILGNKCIWPRLSTLASSFSSDEFQSIDLNISDHLTLSMAIIESKKKNEHKKTFSLSHSHSVIFLLAIAFSKVFVFLVGSVRLSIWGIYLVWIS